MPEYSQIQTYLKCDQNNFYSIIKNFSVTLNSLGLDAKYFTNELEWEYTDEENSHVGGGDYAQLLDNNGNPLHIRPYVMLWTPQVISELQESWLEVSLLFGSEEIVFNSSTGQLKDEHKSLLWAMMKHFSEQFKESGVYFTNEATDGRPWEALVCGAQDNMWAFDAAILPKHLFDVYRDSPKEMYLKKKGNMLCFARKSIWTSEPWHNKN
ncbi:hypothetical protein [Paenibacillus camerounensis]|uniref:hypothetical protein n=1 Tax=Paenibacillus camerounensis TaxID=1243663 RepID=UPI0005A91893|nr:hypothetical protein [Paenibacillus camerounensis]